MKNVVVIVMLLSISMSLSAQNWANVAAKLDQNSKLNVGDKLPFTELHSMINYPNKNLKFSDHHPKLIILDFWATTCTGCVAGWPKTLELQKQFGDDLQIILVDKYEREKLIKDFLKTRKKFTGVDMNLPIALRDSTIWKYFPENSVPRIYWLTPDLVIRSVTQVTQMNPKNISKWIQSGDYEMPQIVDDWAEINMSKPIFVDGNGGTSKSGDFIWSSSLTKGQPNIAGNADAFADPKNGYSIILTSGAIKDLYSIAYNNRAKKDDFFTGFLLFGLPTSRFKLDVKDTAKYYRTPGTAVNTYNYQLMSGKPTTRAKMLEMMQEDLGRYFGLTATWEKRKKMCIVWTMFDSSLAKQYKTSLGKDIFIGDEEVSIDSMSVSNAIRFMEIGTAKYLNTPYPIVDETNYKGILIGIRYEGNAYDLKQFDKDMSRYGIHIKLEPREVDVLVLREPEISN